MPASARTATPEDAIAQHISEHAAATKRNGYAATVSKTEPIGRFGNLVGAQVDVTLEIGMYGVLTYRAFAACSGFGCTEPERKFNDHGCYEVELASVENAAQVMGEARAWAQSHAETCRALPRPTA